MAAGRLQRTEVQLAAGTWQLVETPVRRGEHRGQEAEISGARAEWQSVRREAAAQETQETKRSGGSR